MSSARNPGGNFRPDIEGLRGIAILLVILFHSRVPGFSGGFVGVDVFFALSGYLITGLIVAEVEQTGRLDFKNFYARRVRRLLPASGLLVVFTLMLGLFVYSPLELASYARWAVYTSLYISNIAFMRDAANYFASDIEANPFLHTWSLAVEEQFYLLWPAFVLLALSRLRSRRRLAFALLGVCALSFGLCVWLTGVRQPWAFFSLPSRAWEFALGGLACLLRKSDLERFGMATKAAGYGGLVCVVAAGCFFTAQGKFPGYEAALPVAGTVAMLIAGAAGVKSVLSGILGGRFLQYLGKLSYSWYLWHWPVLLFAVACVPTLGWQGRLAACLVALILAHAAFFVLEQPVRVSSYLMARPALSLCLAAVIPVIGVSTAGLVQRTSNRALRVGEQELFQAASRDSRRLFDAKCLTLAGGSRLKQCEYGETGSSAAVVLFGDSHAEHWFPAIEPIARERHWKLITLLKASCPAAEVDVFSSVLKRPDRECSLWRERALSRITQLRPDLVIVAESDNYVANHAENSSDRLVPPQYWREGIRSLLTYFEGHGLKSLVIADVPRAEFDVPTCLSRAAAKSWAMRECALARGTALNEDARRAEFSAVEGFKGVKLVDFADRFCQGSRCNPIIGGEVVYRDSNHLTSTFARGFASSLDSEIDGLVGPLLLDGAHAHSAPGGAIPADPQAQTGAPN